MQTEAQYLLEAQEDEKEAYADHVYNIQCGDNSFKHYRWIQARETARDERKQARKQAREQRQRQRQFPQIIN